MMEPEGFCRTVLGVDCEEFDNRLDEDAYLGLKPAKFGYPIVKT